MYGPGRRRNLAGRFSSLRTRRYCESFILGSKTASSHPGLDPESPKHLITLDTGLRRYDDIAGWAGFGKALASHEPSTIVHPRPAKAGHPRQQGRQERVRCAFLLTVRAECVEA